MLAIAAIGRLLDPAHYNRKASAAATARVSATTTM
jgi:hypothetical protein